MRLKDMANTCSTGHASRLVNVLQGMDDILLSMIDTGKKKYLEFLKEIQDSIYTELLEEFKPMFDKESNEMEILTEH